MKPSLNLLYVPAAYMGYGRMGVNIAREVRAQHIDVYDHLTGTEKVAEGLSVDAREGRSNVICWLSTPTHAEKWWKGQHAFIYTMWEATRLPEDFRKNLENFEKVIVPSPQNLELFSRFHPDVNYVPLGFDPVEWAYVPRTTPSPYFRFMVCGSGKRKGTDLAYRAFNKLWPTEGSWGDGPIPTLVMKGPRAEAFYGPRIEMVNGRITAEEEIALYAGAHCMIAPSRGEGFGLQPLQAIAQGIPTILTDAHGHESFADYGMGLDSTLDKSAYFIFGNAGDWWEPDFDQLCDYMRWTYDNYAKACAVAKIASEDVHERFTWTHTANGMLDVIGRENLTDYVGPDEWFEPAMQKFRIITIKDHFCNIGGVNYYFNRGEEYWQTADVKRVMFEGGMLDPACLDDDDPANSGLNEQQVERANGYRAEHSRCPTCFRPLDPTEVV